MVSWYANNASQTLARTLYGDQLGQHATPDEISLTRYLYPALPWTPAFLDPEAVNRTLVGRTERCSEGDKAVELLLSGLIPTATGDVRANLFTFGKMALTYMNNEDFRSRFPDGRMWSNPLLSNAEDGERLFETSVTSVTSSLASFLEQ